MLCYPLSLPASKSLNTEQYFSSHHSTFPAFKVQTGHHKKNTPRPTPLIPFQEWPESSCCSFPSVRVRLQILISHFSWDHPDTGIELSSLAQTCWRLAVATHQFTGIVRSRGDLREPGQSSESTNLWNAVNIMNVLLLHNVTPAERSQRRLQQCGGVGS